MKSALAMLALVVAAGCGEGSRACRVAADCASGVCQTDGKCAPLASQTSSSGSSGSATTSSSGSGGSSSSTSGSSGSTSGGSSSSSSGSTGSNTCQPNDDGTITRDEVPLAAGLHATFRIATNATVDSAGSEEDGGTVWDLTGALSGDQNTRVDTTALTGQWFANDFAGATYTTPLSSSSDLLGVFEVTSDALLLRGVVSPTSGTYQTELTYDPAVVVLQFPLTSSATWSTSSTVSGLAQGVYSTYFEDYRASVDKTGTALTPYASFPVMRVATDLTRTVGALVTTQRTFTFVTDCFGPVAVITSQTDETQPEFTSASEVRRLAP